MSTEIRRELKNPPKSLEDDLYNLTMKGKWREVVDIYEKHPIAHETRLTKSEDTALHIAISTYNSRSKNSNHEKLVEKMISHISSSFEILSIKNVRGETPLHLAAAVGWVNICKVIASKNWELVRIRNVNGETPFFPAVHCGNSRSFLCLREIYNKGTKGNEPDENFWRRNKDGNTILHSAISGEYFRLAYKIIGYYPKLVNSVNIVGESPLHVLARKPNVFLSSKHMGFYDSIIYRCVFVDELKKQNVTYNNIAEASQTNHSIGRKINLPENYTTCLNFFRLGTLLLTGSSFWNKQKNKSPDEENQRSRENEADTKDDERKGKDDGFFPPNYTTCNLLFRFAMKVIFIFLGVGIWRIKNVRERKKLYSHASDVMKEMIELESRYKYESTGQRPNRKVEMEQFPETKLPDFAPDVSNNENKKSEKKKTANITQVKDTPILVAAKIGILEIVERIISKCPVAIQDLDSKGKNILMLAAENRQTSVFEYLLKSRKIPTYMFHHLDNEGNNILHHAAMLGEQLQPWRIPGAALQMQWEIKWYKYVKSKAQPQCVAQQNAKGETPKRIFTRTHENLMKAGINWLIKTSESCSVVAALIAAVAFATSSTVPGGLDEESGYPVLRDSPSFGIFSVASLAALCLSVTALVFFLAIITSRCQERDFGISLPRKLLVGLTSLFASIASILLSFCAGHKFILKDSLRFAAVPIYAVASVPVALFALAQLPLYFDLLRAACRKVPLRSYKVF
ncbi:hypothetical protein ABFX02_07G065500 [Erythranthe guttata]